MRLLVLSLILASSLSCRDNTRLVSVPQPPPCEPTDEVCDGLDNDCDGKIDEVLTRECSSICGMGREGCAQGTWSGCTAPLPKTEVCNGADDDCDGFTDEELEVKPCYPRDNSELLFGDCRFGVERCVGGTYQCVGWIGPEPEMCNGKDDDCDGPVDEGTAGALDLVFAVDYSGSMTSSISMLRSTTATWAGKYASRTDLKFALVGIPVDDTSQDGKVTVMLGLSTAQAFATELNKHPNASGGGLEPSIDVIYLLSRPDNPLGIQWTPGSRRGVVVYTDEAPQSYLSPQVTEQQARTEAAGSDTRVFIFTSDFSWGSWNPKPFGAAAALEQELDSVIAQGSCQ